MSTSVDIMALRSYRSAMSKAENTKRKLLARARSLLWSRGYSNVSLREISKSAGVDVALISRYYGSKIGLFKATLEDGFASNWLTAQTAEELVDQVTKVFVHSPRDGENPSILQLLVANANDPEVGPFVRNMHDQRFQAEIVRILGSPERGALFVAAVVGFSVAEKTMQLRGIAPVGTATYEQQVRHALSSATQY